MLCAFTGATSFLITPKSKIALYHFLPFRSHPMRCYFDAKRFSVLKTMKRFAIFFKHLHHLDVSPTGPRATGNSGGCDE